MPPLELEIEETNDFAMPTLKAKKSTAKQRYITFLHPYEKEDGTKVEGNIDDLEALFEVSGVPRGDRELKNLGTWLGWLANQMKNGDIPLPDSEGHYIKTAPLKKIVEAIRKTTPQKDKS